MIITRTPFRMSFFGGGTDLPVFFKMHGGAVLSTTFDKYCYTVVRHLPRFFDYTSEFVYSRTERVRSVDEIEHPAIRGAMQMLDMHEIRLTYEADLPARTGLGTSSSFAVGMLNAFHCLKGSYASKERLAREAIYLERVLCAEAGGWQDQIAASYGGLNKIVFYDDSFEVHPIVIKPERKRVLEKSLMLFFTGFTRFSSDVQRENRPQEKTKQLLEVLSLVNEAESVLVNKHAELDEFGRLLDVGWQLKRSMGPTISTDSIDALYKRALNAGALGGKLLGAGGGGFLLFYAPLDAHDSVRRALSDLMFVPFKFENGGTRVIHYSPENYEFIGEMDSAEAMEPMVGERS